MLMVFEHPDDRCEQLLFGEESDAIDAGAENLKGELPEPSLDSSGQRVGRGKARDRPARFEGEGEARRALVLTADDDRAGGATLRDEREAGGEAASADRKQERRRVGNLAEDFAGEVPPFPAITRTSSKAERKGLPSRFASSIAQSCVSS